MKECKKEAMKATKIEGVEFKKIPKRGESKDFEEEEDMSEIDSGELRLDVRENNENSKLRKKREFRERRD